MEGKVLLMGCGLTGTGVSLTTSSFVSPGLCDDIAFFGLRLPFVLSKATLLPRLDPVSSWSRASCNYKLDVVVIHSYDQTANKL